LIRAVLFDYGETLVVAKNRDELLFQDAVRSVYDVLRAHGLRMGYPEFVERDMEVYGKYAKLEKAERRDLPDAPKSEELVASVFPSQTVSGIKRISREANGAFWRVIAENYRLRAGTKSTLGRLKEMGIRMAVVSNHHNGKALRDHLDELAISSYFSKVVVSSELAYRKPDPRIFRRCLAALDVAERESLFVGDSLDNDIAGAKAIGMLAVLVVKTPGEVVPGVSGFAPDYTVRDLRDVPRIVNRLTRER